MDQSKKGFTIIEVVIVLAIAGLIFAIVFWALPNLQKNQRDGDRRQIVGNMVANLDQYSANSNGAYPDISPPPSGSNTWDSFFTTYYHCSFTNGAALADGTEACTMEDPLVGNYTVTVYDETAGPAAMTTSTATGTMYIQQGGKCNAVGTTTNGNGERALAVMVKLENGIGFCQDNN